MEIVTLSYNRPDFIELQYNSLKKWVKDFTYTVYDNCPDNTVKGECNRLGIKCIPIKIFCPEDPSRCVGDSLNKMWKTLKNTIGQLVYLDSDMFLIDELPDIKDCDFAFVPQTRPNNILYPWTGLMMFNMDTLPHPEKLKWDIAPQLKADVGGFNHYYLKEYNPKILELEMWTIINESKFSFNGGDAIDNDRSYGEMGKIAKKYNFPSPYSFDIFRAKNKTFIFHYKSASNYPSFYTKNYNRLKTEALRKLLKTVNIFGIKNEISIDEIKKYKVDVIIPVYNGEKFIIDAISSVVNQTLPPHKIIIVDDGSTDNTNKLLSEYAKTSEVEIKIVRKENGGLSSARNRGILESESEFIAFLDADDTWEVNKLEEQLRVFLATEYKNLSLVYCDYDLIDIDGKKDLNSYKVPLNKKLRGNVFKELLKSNKILSSGSGVLIKREVLNTVGIFDEKLEFGEDWDMWIRITEKYEVDFVDSVLVHIRRHEGSMSHHLLDVFLGEIDFYNKWVPKLKNQYPIPLEWSDRIIFRMIKMLPKKDSLTILKQKMLVDVYKELFTKRFISIYIYIIFFIIRRTIKLILLPRDLLKLVK